MAHSLRQLNKKFTSLMRRNDVKGFLDIFKPLSAYRKYDILLIASRTRVFHEFVKLILEQEGVSVNVDLEWSWPGDTTITPLHYAARYGHEGLCKLLIEKGAIIDPLDLKGNTPLYHAVDAEQLCTVKFLVSQGASINSRNKQGALPIHQAVVRGFDLLLFLLEQGSDINTTFYDSPVVPDSKRGFTPLHIAVNQKKMAEANVLLEKGARIDIPAANGDTPLLIAIRRKSLEIVKRILQFGPNRRDGKQKNALEIAIGSSGPYNISLPQDVQIQICDMLKEYGFTISQENLPKTFRAAVRKGLIAMVKTVLDNPENDTPSLINASTNSDAVKPIHLAVKTRKKELVEILLDHGANINEADKKRNTPLTIAIKLNDKEMVRFLVARGIDMTKHVHALHIAVASNFTDVAEILLSHGAGVNTVLHYRGYGDESGQSPLEIAAKGEQYDVAALLVAHGADVNLVDRSEKPPIYWAAKNADLKMIDLLILNRCKDHKSLLSAAVLSGSMECIEKVLHLVKDINVVDQNGCTALHLAVEAGKAEIVELLLMNGADVGAYRPDGGTALHMAAEKGSVPIVRSLLTHKANVNAKSQASVCVGTNGFCRGGCAVGKKFPTRGMTPLHVACRGWHATVCGLLLKAGASPNSQDVQGSTPLHYVGMHQRYSYYLPGNDFAGGILRLIQHSELSSFEHIIHDPELFTFIDMLAMYGADVNAKNDSGWTPLTTLVNQLTKWAWKLEQSVLFGSLIMSLLSHGADINYLIEEASPDPSRLELIICSESFFDTHSLSIAHILLDLRWHCEKMQAAGFQIRDDVLRVLRRLNYEFQAGVHAGSSAIYITDEERDSFVKACMEEVHSMAKLCVGPTNITYLKTLSRPNVSRFVRNAEFVDHFDETLVISKFPHYSTLILQIYLCEKRRMALLLSCSKFFSWFSQDHRGLQDCADNIFRHLNYQDLKNLAKVSEGLPSLASTSEATYTEGPEVKRTSKKNSRKRKLAEE